MAERSVYIWGTGRIAARYLNTGELRPEQVLGFIETRRSRETFWGRPVYEPEEVAGRAFDYILVCLCGFSDEIRRTAEACGLPVDRMIFVEGPVWLDGTSVRTEYPAARLRAVGKDGESEEVRRLFPRLYEQFISPMRFEAERLTVVSKNASHLRLHDSVLEEGGPGGFLSREYRHDYFRFRTFELVVNEINRLGVPGAAAELGVFRGTFAKLINRKFPDRKLYLFDTFASFDEGEFAGERALGRCEERFMDVFKDTSVQSVLSIMPAPENCVVRQGLFPGTAAGLEDETYAFVSIDVDFEKSVLEGLRYFYPRLNQGGAIFLHDYNNYFLEGVSAAVDAYEAELGRPLMRVPLADEGGTLVIRK